MTFGARLGNELAAEAECSDAVGQFGRHLEEIVGRQDDAGRCIGGMTRRIGVDAVEQLEIEIVVVEVEVPAAVDIDFIARLAKIPEVYGGDEDTDVEIVGRD